MKKQRATKTLALVLAIVMIVVALPMNVIAVDEEPVQEELVTSTANGRKDYSMPSTSKHAYDPFAQLESEEATKAYRESVQYEEGKIIIKVTETKGVIGGYNEVADSASLESLGIDVSSAEELSRKKVDDGLLTDSYEVIYVADLEDEVEVWEAVDALSATDGVVDAQPNFIYDDTAIDVPTNITKNPHKDKQWQHGPDHLDCDKHWQHMHDEDVTPGEGVVIAVIDTGVDYNHVDLASNMWVNYAEYNGTEGVDDDGNGYIDDIHGVSTVGATRFHNGDPMDDHGHGTHVAGIIAMTANNGEGAVGMAYGAKIMAIKAGQATGIFADADIAEAINYAVAMGADVINMSFGGTGRSFLVEEALANAFSRCVLVASAGNDGVPTSDAPEWYFERWDVFPAGYSCVLGVMATGKDGKLASFSNWDYYGNGGSAEYEITAPGVDIWSTLPGNNYAMWDGTSMAAPIVAAAAALIRSAYPDRELYSSRFIMGQLASASKKTTVHTTRIDEVYDPGKKYVYTALDIESSLNNLPKPNLTVKNTYLFDDPAIDPANDGDGIIDAGETIDLGIVIRNQWGMAKDVTVKVDAISTGGVPNPNIEWIIDEITLENVGTFNEQNNAFVYDNDVLLGTNNPIRFKVNSDTINDANIAINITITAKNALEEKDKDIYEFNDAFSFYVQRGKTLRGYIVDDMVLTSEYYWIVEDDVIISNATVTVEPGTQIQFWGSESTIASISGKFVVNGTVDNPVEMFPASSHSTRAVQLKSGQYNYARILNPHIADGTYNHCEMVNMKSYYYHTSLSSSGYATSNRCMGLHDGTFNSCIFRGLGDDYTILKDANTTVTNCLFDDCNLSINNGLNGTTYKKNVFNGGKITISEPTINLNRIVLNDSNRSPIYEYGDKKYIVLDMSITSYNRQGSQEKSFLWNYIANVRGGTLLYIDDEMEREFILGVLEESKYYNVSFLISGAYDQPTDDDHVYVISGNRDIYDAYSISYVDVILEFPNTVDNSEITRSISAQESSLASHYSGLKYPDAYQNNDFEFNSLLGKNIKMATSESYQYYLNALFNYWGTSNEKLIQTMISDADTHASLADIVTTPYLTLESPELENIYPFVTEIYITDTEGNRLSEVSYGQELTVHVKFNRDMDMNVQPMVTYGPAEPYTDYVLNGDFVSPREWCAEFKPLGVIDAGMEFFRVKDAVAADDAWLKTGTDTARFAFEISRTGAQAMVLQAAGGENKVNLEWMQDDYDTLAGFNVYRSTSENGSFTKLNSYLIPSTIREFTDTDVKPGVEYFYYFTVMGTDLVESKPSNTASASPLDNVKPVFSHSRITAGNTGAAIAFNITASDNIAVESVKLYWRTVGAEAWNELEMTSSSGDSYFATIAGNYVTSAGIEYYISISDGVNTVYDGSADAPIRIVVDYSMVIFNVTPSKVEASAVAAGLTATLTGVNFADTMVLYVGGNVVEYEYIDSTQIRFTVPAGTIGRVDLKLVDGEREASLANAFTYTDASNSVVIGSVDEVMSKETVELPIIINASGDIYGVDLQLQLTKSLYSSIKFKKAEGMLSAITSCTTSSAGVTKISVASDDVLPNGTAIGYLCLATNAVTDPVSTTVNVVSAKVNAVDITNLSSVTLNIVPNFTVSGKITYYHSKTGIAGVTVTLSNGMTTVTDENGNYSFEGIKTSNVVVTPSFKGNVNGAISSQDASLVLQAVTDDATTLTDHQFIAADVDGDGVLTSLDASYILRKTVGKITGDFPGTLAEWAFSEKIKVLSLTQNATNVNFTAVLLGDVTGNWTSTPIEEVE